MRFIGDIALDAEVRAIASGAITDGASVIVNADGTVSSVSSSPDSLGDQSSDVYSGPYGMSANVYDTGQDKVLFVYSGPSNYGTAAVGTVSNNSVSFGTPVVFSSATTYYLTATFDPDTGKTGIFWADYGDSTKGKACVATISGTSVSYGTTVTFNSNSASVPIKDSTYNTSENKILVAYTESNSSSKIIAATISGTDISFGTPVEFLSTGTNEVTIQYDTNVNKSLVAYRNSNNSNKVDSRVVSLSGTSVTLGSETSLYNAIGDKLASTYDSTNNKIVVAYRHDSGTTHMKFVVATISGTSVSYGTPADTGINFTQSPCTENFSYNVSANKVIFAGRDGGNSNIQKYISGRVSGTSISMDTAVTYFSAAASYQSNSVYDPDQEKTILFYANGSAGAFVNPVTRVLTLGEGDNITSENYIGIANAAYADGQKATVKTTGSIARNALSIPAQSASSGSHVTFEAGTSSNQGIAYDTNSNRVVIVYKDSGNSHYGTAIVGTLDGTSISFGTAVVYNSNESNFNAVVFDPDTNKMILTYQDNTSDHTQFRVGIVSGTAISFPASETTWSNNTCNDMSITYDTINDRVVVFAKETNNNGVVVGGSGYGSDNTVEGSSPTTFATNITSRPTSIIFIEEAVGTNRRIVTAFTDGGDSNKGKVMPGYPAGSAYATTGSLTLFNNADTHYISMVKLPTIDQEGQFVVAYEDNGSGGIGKAKVGQFDKSDGSIGFGSEATFTSSAVAEIQAVYDTSRDLVHIAFSDAGNSEYLAIVTGTVSGNSISFGSKTVLNSVASVSVAAVYVPDGDYVVISYQDNSVDGRGKSVVYSPPSDQVNLTIGQQYFVQTDGTLGTSADSPSVIAGTAIGASDIVVKG